MTEENSTPQSKQPAVSVIMPVYNAIKYVETAISSILSQTFRDFELILVDDGSTDGSAKVCDACAQRDGRIRVFHRENGGVSSARNYGLRVAQGEYIAFIDHDDCYLPDYLERMVACIRETGVQVVRCGRLNIGVEKAGNTRSCGASYPKERLVLSNGEFARAYPKYKQIKYMLTSVWTGLYKRELIQRHQVEFPEAFRHGSEDVMFNVRMYVAGADIAMLPSILYVHYVREAQSTSAVFHEELIPAELEVIDAERQFVQKAAPEHAGVFDYYEFDGYMRLVSRVPGIDRKMEYVRRLEPRLPLQTCPLRYIRHSGHMRMLRWILLWLRQYRVYFLANKVYVKCRNRLLLLRRKLRALGK